MRRYLASLLLLFGPGTFSAVTAQAAHRTTLPAEVMLLAPTGFTMLGHGTMDGNVLRLEVLEEVGDFVMLVIGPTGAIERFAGRQGVDGELRLDPTDGGDVQLLKQFFGARAIELVVVRRSRLDEDDGASEVADVDVPDTGPERPDEETETVADDEDADDIEDDVDDAADDDADEDEDVDDADTDADGADGDDDVDDNDNDTDEDDDADADDDADDDADTADDADEDDADDDD